jgi:glutamine amidotransferase-like uncharacterized protein
MKNSKKSVCILRRNKPFHSYFGGGCYFQDTNEMMKKFPFIIDLYKVVKPHIDISTVYVVQTNN